MAGDWPSGTHSRPHQLMHVFHLFIRCRLSFGRLHPVANSSVYLYALECNTPGELLITSRPLAAVHALLYHPKTRLPPPVAPINLTTVNKVMSPLPPTGGIVVLHITHKVGRSGRLKWPLRLLSFASREAGSTTYDARPYRSRT